MLLQILVYPDDSVRYFRVDMNLFGGALWLWLGKLTMLKHALVIHVEDAFFLLG